MAIEAAAQVLLTCRSVSCRQPACSCGHVPIVWVFAVRCVVTGSERGVIAGMPQLWLALLTFLYVDFLDCTGTLFSMANFINNFIPGAVPHPPSPRLPLFDLTSAHRCLSTLNPKPRTSRVLVSLGRRPDCVS